MAEVKGALPDFGLLMPQAQPTAAPAPVGWPVAPEKKPKRVGAWLFQRGQSGNPGGTHKSAGEIKKLARQYSETAILTLVDICEDEEAPAAARVAAANGLLDRGHGKAVQPVEVGGPGAFDNMSDEEVREYAKSRARMMIEGTVEI